MFNSKHGFALVLVLWVLTLLSLMAGSFALTMRREASVTLGLKNNANAEALAESGLNYALFMLQQPDPNNRWLADGSIYQIPRLDGSEMRIKIISESGKIDINTASENLLTALFDSITKDSFQTQKLLNTLLDWRDEDDQARMNGAENKEYADAGLYYGPANKPFDSLEDLQLVLGFDETLFKKIQPLVTIYSGQANVDVNMAQPAVLDIVANVATNNANGQPVGQQSVATPTNAATNVPANAISTNINKSFLIDVDIRMLDGAAASLEAVVRLQAQNPNQSSISNLILNWKQNQITGSLFLNEMQSPIITLRDEFTNNN